MCMCPCHCLSYPVSVSRSLLDATTSNTTDRLRVISLSPLTHTQIFIRAQPSQCTVWHQQSCATRTRPCGDFRDLEKMSQIFSSLVGTLFHRTINVTSYFKKRIQREHKDWYVFHLGKIHFTHPQSAFTFG